MRAWLERFGKKFQYPPGKPSYLGALPNQPFPLNPNFRSQPVLSEESREMIWKRIMEEGESIKVVSAEYSVDMRRVAAVVRMKEIEKEWARKVWMGPSHCPLLGGDIH
jgi:hypothetical protein